MDETTISLVGLIFLFLNGIKAMRRSERIGTVLEYEQIRVLAAFCWTKKLLAGKVHFGFINTTTS